MHIQTVNGRIPPHLLGITLPHEHILLDFTCTWTPSPEESVDLSGAGISENIIEQVRNNPHHVRSNLILDDEQAAIQELEYFSKAGGQSVVDLTTRGLSPDPIRLRNISTATGLHIIAGCGFYRAIAQEQPVLAQKAEALAALIIQDLEVGINGTDVVAGIIGEVGTSYPLHPFERESLIAAAWAQRATGVAINVHPEIWHRAHLDVLEILEAAGADLERVVMSHMDELPDSKWHGRVAERGTYLSFDTFGSEFSFDGVQEPRDVDRIQCLIELLEMGYVDQVLLSQDICYKIELHRYGGRGYDHLIQNILPQLRSRGVSEIELHKMLVENPARLLAIAGPQN
jgi:phosphotriesterase-related protein